MNVSSQRPTILLVEDERAITEPLAEALEREGFNAAVAGTAAEAMETAASRDPDLVLLDIGLPDGSGLDVCRELRKQSQVPIIMLTARGAEADRVVGPRARRRRLHRQALLGPRGDGAGQGGAAESHRHAERRRRRARSGSAISASTRRSTRHDSASEPIELSRKEFELLRVLMESAGSVLTREALIDEVWDMNWFGSTKTLDVHVSGLRKKLGDDPKEPRYIHTVRGVGFRFSGADEA